MTYFEGFARKKYKFQNYKNINQPTIFYGCYNLVDIRRLSMHKGPKILIWGGSDILKNDMVQYVKKIKNIKHIAQSKFIENDLKRLGLDYQSLAFAPTINYEKFKPVEKGNAIYIYLNAANPNFFKMDLCQKLMKHYPDIKFIFTASKQSINDCKKQGMATNYLQYFAPDKIINAYKQCFIGLRLVKHDGVSATVQEMGLMGIKTIHNGNSPSSINFKNYEDIIKIIDEERKTIGEIDIELSNKVKEYLKLADEQLWKILIPSHDLQAES